nr:HD domain-containing phosphohydrolase [Rhabdothermincola salaria]
MVVGLTAPTWSPAWWAAHGVQAASVLVAVGAGLVLALRNRTLAATIAPLIAGDPIGALELGLRPEIHAFVAALDRKDQITRDHVVRVSALALRVGERAGLAPRRLRALGLGALLHDVGKLVIPSDILTKPGKLTAEEYSVIKGHPARGAALLACDPELAAVAPLVRGHHERHDGHGYPDGLAGDEIPLEVAIISVVDAWDAMTNDRQYRAGRSGDRARAVLEEGAGTQWDPGAVELVLAELDRPSLRRGLEEVGRRASAPGLICPEALPAGWGELEVGAGSLEG